MRFVLSTLVLITSTVGVSGCADVEELGSVELRATGIEPLAGGFHYEAWAVIDGAPVTLAKFNVDASETITDLEGIAIPGSTIDTNRDLSEATGFLLTIEADGDTDISPSDSTYLFGARIDDGATLEVGGELAFGDDFSNAAGRYFLATPTDGAADSDEESGVWFFDISTDPITAGLTLPELPAGFAYEGWAVIDGMPVSTGRFREASGADSAAPHSATVAPGPGFPGEDFLLRPPGSLRFPTNLSTMSVVVTVEPHPDDSPAPFTLKPLRSVVRANAAPRQTFDMDLVIDDFPTLEVTLHE